MEGEEGPVVAGMESKPKFLEKIDEEVYMGAEEGLEDRVARYRHTRQRNLDNASFLT